MLEYILKVVKKHINVLEREFYWLVGKCVLFVTCLKVFTALYLDSSQKYQLFAKMVIDLKPLTISAKSSVLDF